METWPLQETITKASLILLACFCVVYSIITILYYYKQFVKGDSSFNGDQNESSPFSFLFGSVMHRLLYPYYSVMRFLRNRKKRKAEADKLKQTLPFKVPFKYSLYLEKAYEKYDAERAVIEIYPKGSTFKYIGELYVDAKPDGTWGYTKFSIHKFCKTNQNFKDANLSMHQILDVGTSLLHLDKEMKSIIAVFKKHVKESELGYGLADKWQKWINQVDNFEAMKGHNAINKK